MADRFQDKLFETQDFVYSMEAVPGRGLEARDLDLLEEEARAAKAHGKVDILSFTDNPGGNTRLAPDFLATHLSSVTGLPALVHIACKDMNRAALESRLYQLWKMGAKNILALTGDYPLPAYRGTAKPVFDIDAVTLLRQISDLNAGLLVPGRKPGTENRLSATAFAAGAAVSPFKRDEAELLMQYAKLNLKVENGARFAYTQIGYNARKFDELARVVRAQGANLPLIGNVFVPHAVVSRMMHDNLLPGCVVTPALLAKIKEWATGPDKGKARFLEFAAKQVAILRGLGYRGVHLGGFGLKFPEFASVIDQSERMAADWKSFIPELLFEDAGEFYLYQKDGATGLNTDTPNPALLRKGSKELSHSPMRLLHGLIFSDRSPFFRPSVAVSKFLAKHEGLSRKVDRLEHTAKFFSNGCRHCGDCALPHTTYLCPEEECAKHLRNGPCGGSTRGKCEVFKHKDCFWARIYRRRKSYGEIGAFEGVQLPPRDWALYHTSSWVNYFTGKDNARLKT